MTSDSVRAQSVCKDEWVRALKYKKPVIPLLVERGAELPFRLGSREYIDFTGSPETALARLREHLEWLQSPAGQLQQLKYRLADAQRELRRAATEQSTRVQGDIAELEAQIAHQEGILANPAAAEQRVDERVEHGLERERAPVKPLGGVQHRAKFINPPPAVPPTWFQNRHSESKSLANFLRDPGLRLMTVVGRGGNGKSAMVCRLLKFLEVGQLPDDLGTLDVDGIVYLSNARTSHPVTVPELYRGITQLLPEEIAQRIETLYRDPQAQTRDVLEGLSKALSDGRRIVLLDNFEDSLDASAQIASAELNEVLRGFLELPFQGLKVIITTRVAPTDLADVEPGRQRRLDLEKGLEHPFAEDVLRAMDQDGLAGLQDASEALLSEARERTRGNPRALEHLYGILSADRDTTLQEILNDTRRLLPGKVVEVLVGEAFNRLDLPAQRVMQALATYRYPVPPVAVDYLLRPHVKGVDSAPILKRLVNMQFARRESGRYYLHPVDREYALGRIPQGNVDDKNAESPLLSQFTLAHRAAEWYKETRKPREDWRNLEDLAPQLREFELRVTAEEYDDAAAVLQEITYDYLETWGHFGLSIDLNGRLQGKITDPALETASAINLGNSLIRVGQCPEAIACYERALERARENASRIDESCARNGLGLAYAYLGDDDRAIEHYEAALAIDREVNNRAGEAIDLMNLANRYSSSGQESKAIEYYQAALDIDREVEDKRGEALILTNLGDSYRILADSAGALKCLAESYRIARDEKYQLVEAAALTFEGQVYFAEGAYAAAAGRFLSAIELADSSGIIQFQCGARAQLAWVHLCRDELASAEEVTRRAAGFNYPLNRNEAVLALGVVVLRRGDASSAKDALVAAVNQSDDLLSRSAKNPDALDVKGLAFCALALCDNVTHLDAARECFQAARLITSAPGRIKLLLQQFDALARADKTGLLIPLRKIAAGV
jgi:tetratricopeptide (TPR) repeat protein